MAEIKVKDELKAEFDKASTYSLTDEDIERARLLVGIDLASRDSEQIHTATEDNIRCFAFGCGSDNPLHTDPEYARGTRWGSVIGMGVFIGQSTRIYNRATGEVSYGRVPAGSVVVSGSLPSADGKYSLYCAVIVKQVDEKTRGKTSVNDLLRGAVE